MQKKELFIITTATVAVSFAYYFGSVFLIGERFYFFDALWRLSIIFLVLGIAKYKFEISQKQSFLLLGLFFTEFVLYQVLSPAMPLLRILISVALAPIAEELFFRGWMMSKIEGGMKKKMFITSVLFAFYHLKNFNVLSTQALITQILYAGCIVGPIFAYARLRYNSLFVSILLHSGNNTIAETITKQFIPLISKRQENFK